MNLFCTTVLVKVTAEDIANGKRKCSRGCMVAIALNRATGRNDWRVAYTRAENSEGGRAIIPFWVFRLITRWDMGEDIAPFEFAIEG